MSISCIIPTRNRCHMIGEAVESILRQTISGIEIIVVDDGSTDETVSFLNKTYAQVKLVRLAGQVGPGMARNVGVQVARGDIVMFLDSDDRWLPQHAASLQEVLDRDFEFAYGTTLTEDLLAGDQFLIPDKGRGFHGDCLSALARWCFLVPSSVALTRKAFERVGGFTGDRLGEDWVFFVKLAERYRFGFVGPEPITIRQLHKDSLCCLEDKGLLVHAIRRVGEILGANRKIEKSVVQRLQYLEKWTRERGTEWKSVQEWYCAMKEEGMI